jgi:hypothetical protein
VTLPLKYNDDFGKNRVGKPPQSNRRASETDAQRLNDRKNNALSYKDTRPGGFFQAYSAKNLVF